MGFRTWLTRKPRIAEAHQLFVSVRPHLHGPARHGALGDADDCRLWLCADHGRSYLRPALLHVYRHKNSGLSFLRYRIFPQMAA